MSRDFRAQIERIRARIRSDDSISDADRDALLDASEYIDMLGSAEYSDKRHRFYLMRWANLASAVGGLARGLDDQDAVESLLAWINTEYDNPETNKDYRVALRNFGTIAARADEPPESFAWVPAGYPSTYDPAPDPAEMLHWGEHIIPMVKACRNPRDEALITLAWDLGPRPGELFGLRVGDITDHKYGKQVTVQGKRGQRSPVIIASVAYVQQWVQRHPGDETDYMWTKLNEPERVSERMFRKVFEEAAERAGVTRPINPRNFRKSSASYLASQNVNQAHLEDHHGWSRGSEVASRYISVFGESTDREIARAHGVDVESDEADPITPLTCPRCQRETPREKDLCVWCGQALSHEAVEAVEDQRERSISDAAEVDEEADAVVKLDRFLEENPDVRAELLNS